MQSLDSEADLKHDAPGLLLVERLLGLPLQVIEQVAASHEFGHDEEVLAVLERLNQLQSVHGSVFRALGQDLHLLEASFAPLEQELYLSLVHDLDCHFDA